MSRGRIVVLAIEAVMQHFKSAAGAKSSAKNVSIVVRYFLARHSDEQVTLTGESPLVLLHDFLGQAASRGRAVPPAIRHSLC